VTIPFDSADAMYGLVGAIVTLLLTVCWNAWLLLIEEK
jgi:hypothetical protein